MCVGVKQTSDRFANPKTVAPAIGRNDFPRKREPMLSVLDSDVVEEEDIIFSHSA
jgi:hypothetical protein